MGSRRQYRAHLRRIAELLFCLCSLAAASHAAAASSPLTLQISSEVAPPGGWAQIKIYPVSPAPVDFGSITMTLDPAVFGTVAAVGVFSVNGDAGAAAQTLSNGRLSVNFSSPTGGIGRLNHMPVLTVTIPAPFLCFPQLLREAGLRSPPTRARALGATRTTTSIP